MSKKLITNKSSSKKTSRKELLKEDDAFISAAQHSAEWAKKHRIQIVGGVVLVVAIVAGLWGGATYIKKRNSTSSESLQAAMKIMQADVVDDDADPTGDPPTFASEEARRKAAEEKLKEAVKQGGGSGVVDLAQFYLADFAVDNGDLPGAEEQFTALVVRIPATDPLYFLAVERLAYVQEAQGNDDAALLTLARLAERDKAFYTDVASYHQARIYQSKGDKERARSLLESIEKNHENSVALEEVKARLDVLGRSPKTPEAAAKPDAAGKDSKGG